MTWLLFTYKVPNEPSARRVYVWRRLKGLGAILVHDTAWVLPATPHTREKLQWLSAEVNEMNGGETTLWESKQIFTGRESDLSHMFSDQVDSQYHVLLDELNEKDADLNSIAKRYQQILRQDYFGSELGREVRQKILERREPAHT